MLILIRNVLFAALKGVGALGLGGVILWQVAERSGSHKGIAYVHVSMGDVDVMVDDAEYHVESLWQTPIVCELGPGNHTVRMSRDGRTLFEEEFTLSPGKEIVLSAWEGHSDTQVKAVAPSLSFHEPHVPSPPARRIQRAAEYTCPDSIFPRSFGVR
jgi:hypothetical protein